MTLEQILTPALRDEFANGIALSLSTANVSTAKECKTLADGIVILASDLEREVGSLMRQLGVSASKREIRKFTESVFLRIAEIIDAWPGEGRA